MRLAWLAVAVALAAPAAASADRARPVTRGESFEKTLPHKTWVPHPKRGDSRRVSQVPSKNKIVIGQIHSKDEPGSQNDPLLKLQYHYRNGVGRIEALLRKRPGDKVVHNILIAENIQLGERFGYDLRLTPTGRALLRRAKQREAEVEAEISGHLDAATRDVVIAALRRIAGA